MIIQDLINSIVKDPSLVFSGLCLALAGVSNAVHDILGNEVKFDTSVFKRLPRAWWLSSESWKNKYKRYATGALVVAKYDADNRPIYQERFMGSTTFLVFLTDGWHFSKFMQWSFVAAAVMYAAKTRPDDLIFWLGVVTMKGFISSSFEIFYSSILRARL